MLKIVEYTLKTIFLSILLSACGGSEKIDHLHNQGKVIASINQKMSEQETCWNTGDLECFMQHYWHSDSLLFIGKSGLTYGWQPTLDNYISSYPDKLAMGKLTFTNEVKEFIDIETVQVIGQWELQRDSLENLGGFYSLVWKIKKGEWVIVSDHSS
ncbi:MAG: DUF4440 domain-containing protein [Bacteroidetes bacterium]|nr:DUF4440 domain-containing protein [Bacteroidota bacterium]